MPVAVGDVLHAFAQTTSPPKPKFFVVVCCVDPVRVVFINTKNRAVVLQTPALAPTQVPVSKNELTCLTHDSWIGCHEVSGWPDDLESVVAGGGARGRVSDTTLQRILAAIESSPLIPAKQIKRCSTAIKAKLGVVDDAGGK